MINALIDVHETNSAYAFVASCFAACLQPPILINRTLFPALLELKGDQGALQILKKHMDNGKLYSFMEEKLFVDIDREEEYKYWKNKV
jgi:molybdenum cofactor cytidylyltransferase